jgi:AraC-like DNA-binding protein
MDPLSEVLRDLRLDSTVFCVFELRAPWGLQKPHHEGAPFHVITEGRCWVQFEHENPIELSAGDVVVVPHGEGHELLSSLGAPSEPIRTVLRRHGLSGEWKPGMRPARPVEIRHGSTAGELTRVVSGVFAFHDHRRNPVLETLPRFIRISGENGSAKPWLKAVLRLLVDEAFSAAPGGMTVVERAADILFVQAVRAHVQSSKDSASGWLRGLMDPKIGLALSLIHARPAMPWTIELLAHEVGLSRTVLAERFRHLVGDTVMAYVTCRRMHVAAGMLCNGGGNLAQIAQRVGYESEVSFSKAFRSWAGEPPGRYRRRMRDPSAD